VNGNDDGNPDTVSRVRVVPPEATSSVRVAVAALLE